ncbi:MAG: DUF4230 domain-containing protein [Ginsengibacter sp.]
MRLLSLFCLFGFLFITAGCKHHNLKERQEKAMMLKELNDLVTVEYVVTKIIRASDDTWFKIGTRKILMSCKATLRAGIDLSKITEKNIDIQNKSISLHLPHATLLSLDIKPEDLKTEYEDVSLLRSSFSSAEIDAFAVQGESNIRKSADSLGILQTAEINANFILTGFLRRLGYEKISIDYDMVNTPLQ